MTNGKRNRLKLKQARSAGTRSGAAKHAAKNRRLKAVCATPAEVTDFYRPNLVRCVTPDVVRFAYDDAAFVTPLAKPTDFDPAVQGAISRADRLADRYADYAPGASGLNGGFTSTTITFEVPDWEYIGEEKTFRQVATDFLYEHQTAFYVVGLILVFITVAVMAA